MSTRQQLTLKSQVDKKPAHTSFSVDEKMRIVLEGLKGDIGINALCSNEGINPNLLNTWTKLYLEGARKGLIGSIEPIAEAQEIEALKCENKNLKQLVAELTLEIRMSVK